MQSLINTTAVKTMTSREIAELTGKEHRHVVRDIDSMFAQLAMDPEGYAQNWTHPQNQQEYRGYALPEDLTLNLVAGYNAALRLRIIRRWKELESAGAPARALSPAEMFLQNAQAMVDIERRQLEQEQAVALIAGRVEQVEQQQLLTSRPSNAESIVHLRPRAAKMFGVPERVVEHIIRQSPYAPRPAGMVRNDKECAQGSTYAVYWIKDVNDVMRRFCAECVMVTPSFATHPYVGGKFKITTKDAA